MRHNLKNNDTAYGDGFAWFLATVKPNRFAQANFNLQNQGFETFMPMLERTVRHGRTTKTVMRPAFPGYIFVGYDRDVKQWRVINNTFGVSGLVMRADTPVQVHKILMSSLMERCDNAGKLLPPQEFSAGDKVRVLSGPFQDFLAEVEHTTDGERVRLLLDLMGRAVTVNCAGNRLQILNH